LRADRLLSLLMLLQTRGRMTARQLAGELEVSERTIYRDIDALSLAGIPVYGEAGRAGGYALLDHYRTSLTGLTDGELRALFMLSIPAPLDALGVSQDLKAALRKLSAALPGERRQDEARVRQRFYLDSAGWRHEGEPVPHLQTIYQAVWQNRRLQVSYHALPGVEIEQQVDPYGLVAKGGAWYLVYAWKKRLRARRVAGLLDARLAEDRFERPPDFDLEAFWKSWCAEREESRSLYRVQARVAPGFIPWLTFYLGEQGRTALAAAGPADSAGWISLELRFESLEAARERLLGFGAGVRVLAPEALRLSIQDYAAQICGLYAREAGRG
jgi:predicted DNA-binding transcriptional regulator YafY